MRKVKIYRNFLKPTFDYLLAIIALVISMPLTLPVTLILLLTGEHEVFYRQDRIGFKNSRFNIYKFVTMKKGSADKETGSLTLRNDKRVTTFGRILRAMKVNELPQILNVLTGRMSFVGPRPQMDFEFDCYSEEVREVIYNTPPGITGIGSIIFRDEEKQISAAEGDKHKFYKNNIAPYKGELELWYLEHISFRTDIALLFITAWVIFYPKSNIIYKIFGDLPVK